jgi:CHAD domain-containing protein
MSYQLESGEVPAEGIRRIAREQLGKALCEIEKIAGARAAPAVHATRKHIKRVRALLRLICDEIGEEIFAEENRRLRDVARSLSGARDAQVQFNVLEKLCEDARQRKSAFRRTAATLRHEIASASTDLSAEQKPAETTLQWIDDRLEGWPLDDLDLETLCCALERFYGRGRKGLARAKSRPTAKNFHSWRKRVKDVWYQALLLRNLNPIVMCQLADAADLLGRQLGDLHDLAFFRSRLETKEEFPEAERALLLGLICAHERAMEEAALDLGARFFAEKPKAFAQRLLRYAKEWPARYGQL